MVEPLSAGVTFSDALLDTGDVLCFERCVLHGFCLCRSLRWVEGGVAVRCNLLTRRTHRLDDDDGAPPPPGRRTHFRNAIGFYHYLAQVARV